MLNNPQNPKPRNKKISHAKQTYKNIPKRSKNAMWTKNTPKKVVSSSNMLQENQKNTCLLTKKRDVEKEENKKRKSNKQNQKESKLWNKKRPPAPAPQEDAAVKRLEADLERARRDERL